MDKSQQQDIVQVLKLTSRIEQLSYQISDAEWQGFDKRADKLSNELRSIKTKVTETIEKIESSWT